MAIMKFAPSALKNLFKKPVTTSYPFKEAVYPAASRGHIEPDMEKCVMCTLCQKKCPSGAITVDRENKTWQINRMACVQCANCVNSCPRSCLKIVPGYPEPSSKKQVDIYKKPGENS